MSVNGKRNGFTRADLAACAKSASMKRGRHKAILEEVVQAVSRWREVADDAGVPSARRDQIQGTLRLDRFNGP